MNNKHPNLSLTLLLFCILVPPFALRHRYGIEPYPAIILPSSASSINLKKSEIIFNKINIFGKDRENKVWRKIDSENFLVPVPVHYLEAIVKNSFGLNSIEGKTSNLPLGINTINHKITYSEIKDTKQWLSQKLTAYGYASNEMMVSIEQIVFDVETGEAITSKKTYEEIFRLD